MSNRLICPSEVAPNDSQSKQEALNIPENMSIVIMQRDAGVITAKYSGWMSENNAQLLCKMLFESSPNLSSGDQAQGICEAHGAVFTSCVGSSFNEMVDWYYYGADFLLEHYSALGHRIESRLGDLKKIYLEFDDVRASLSFAVCMCFL